MELLLAPPFIEAWTLGHHLEHGWLLFGLIHEASEEGGSSFDLSVDDLLDFILLALSLELPLRGDGSGGDT